LHYKRVNGGHLGWKLGCLEPKEEFDEQMNLMGFGPRHSQISRYGLITPKAHLLHLAVCDAAVLSPHHTGVHGRRTGLHKSLHSGNILKNITQKQDEHVNFAC